MKTEKQIQDRANELNFKVSQNKKAFRELPSHVPDNDEIIAFFDATLHLMVLTNNRVIMIKAGLLMSTDVVEIELENIQNIGIDGKILFTEVEITSGSKKYAISVPKKDLANTIKNKINEAITNKKSAVSNGSSSNDVLGQLEKLASLKEKGILSEIEYNEQKQKLLAKL